MSERAWNARSSVNAAPQGHGLETENPVWHGEKVCGVKWLN